jgi:hypothetical protein
MEMNLVEFYAWRQLLTSLDVAQSSAGGFNFRELHNHVISLQKSSDQNKAHRI